MAAEAPTVLHTITPVDVEICGPRAFAVSVGSIRARFERSGHAYDLVSHCRFLSRVQKVEGRFRTGWKVLSMEVIYIFDTITPAEPSGSNYFPVVDDTSPERRSSYRYLAWLLKQQGREVNQNMPGVDKEETVKEVMERNRSWVYEI